MASQFLIKNTMQNYKNVSGDSNVIAYELGDTYIRVQFGDYYIYRYTYTSAGRTNIEHMKRLATQGHGLNAFINTNVKFGYERKE